MRKLFLLLTLFAVGSLSAQGNGDFVSFQFVKTTPGEQYNVILNEKWIRHSIFHTVMRFL
jgi:hypothetical protein